MVFFFFFSCPFGLKVGWIGRHHSSREGIDTEGYRKLQASFSLKKCKYIASPHPMSQSSQKPFPSFTAPLFCHPCLLTFSLAQGFLPALGSAWRNDACLKVAAAGEPSGGPQGGSVTVGHLSWSVLALGGLWCLCHTGQPPSPLSSPSPQTQSQPSCSKCKQVLSAVASWKSGLVPDNHGITQTAFRSPLSLSA